MAKQSESSSLKYFELDRHARDSFFSMAPYFSPADANLCSLNPSDLLHAVRPLGSAPTTEEVIPGLAVERLFPHQRKNLYRLLEIEARDDVTPQSGVPHPFYLPIRISSERWAEFGGLPPPIEGAPVTLYIDELTGTVTERRFDAPPLPRACILGDAPGLGKTVTALALLAKTTDLSKPLKPHPPRPEDPEQLSCVDATLIVVPNHLSWQWIEELRSRLPGFKIHLHEIEPKSTVPQQRASGRTRQNEVERLIPDGPVIGGARGSEFRRARENGVESIRLQRFGTHHIVLTTFGGSGSSSKWEDLSSVHWKRMIVDECQNLRAENSRMLELLLSVNCGSRIILGGTPFHADRIQSLYAYCWFFGMKAFEFSDTIDRLLQPVFDADPQSAAASRLRGLIAHILLRYTKDDVVIPPLHESVMRVKLSLRDQWLYERAKFAAHVKLETAVQARNQLRRHWIRCSLQPDEFKENLSTAEIGAVERHVNHLRLRASSKCLSPTISSAVGHQYPLQCPTKASSNPLASFPISDGSSQFLASIRVELSDCLPNPYR